MFRQPHEAIEASRPVTGPRASEIAGTNPRPPSVQSYSASASQAPPLAAAAAAGVAAPTAAAPALRIGTSGWVYKHWIGCFYPPSMPGDQYLPFYGESF